MSAEKTTAGTRESAPPPPAVGRPLTPADVGTVQLIPMELLHRSPYQVRREGDVTGLAADIRAHGLVNPITVRKRARNDGFEVVAGHRRWAAMRSIDPEGEVPCIVLDVDDRTAEELLVAENFVRADLSIMEQAETVALLTLHGRTAEECGQVCRRSVRWAHRMRAIGGIGEPWRGFLHVAGLPYACALAVARLPEAVREDAWRAYCEDLAVDLSDPDADADQRSVVAGQVECLLRDPERGLAQGAAAFEVARSWLASHAADEELRARLATVAGTRAFLEESPENGPRFALDDPAGPIGGALSRFRALADAPFDVAGCAGCARRSDRAPDLWGEDDGRAAPARCLDCDCWAKRAAEHVRTTLEAAASRGVTAAAEQSSSYDWRDRDTLEQALEEADGDASRVTPVVKVVPGGGHPTGRVLWRVAEPDAEEGEPAEKPAPPKREPWEEWCPENPRWMPTLFGDARDRAWFAAGLAVGLAYHADADDRDEWFRRALRCVAAKDFAALVARCEFVRELGGRRADFLTADVAVYSGVEGVREAARVYREALTHLPAHGSQDDEEAGDE